MKFVKNNPPRKFNTGKKGKIEISDCGKITLGENEQLTLMTPSGREYDVARKSWGFYATPSINSRLKNFGFKTALVQNDLGRYYIMIVEKEKMADFKQYLLDENHIVVEWLDERG